MALMPLDDVGCCLYGLECALGFAQHVRLGPADFRTQASGLGVSIESAQL